MALSTRITALTLATVLTASASAAAATATGTERRGPTAGQYDSTAQQVGAQVADASSGLSRQVVEGLPFTGLDVLIVLATAAMLGSIGIVLARLSRSTVAEIDDARH